VRLILPRLQAAPGEEENRYARAAADFAKWRREGVLLRDEQPALYYWETEFAHLGRRVIRHGVVGLLRLETFESGRVKPHEKTFSATKNDRFQLIQHCMAHFSTIFGLYPDPRDTVMEMLRQGCDGPPQIDFEDAAGLRHRSHRVSDPRILREVCGAMQDFPVFIADGHHRYETSLAIQSWLQQQYPKASEKATFNYVLMYLSNMRDPGLVILPAHRLLNTGRLPQFDEAALWAKLPEYFTCTPLALKPGEVNDNAQMIAAALEQAGRQGTALVVVNGQFKGSILTLKDGVKEKMTAAQIPPALAELDVVALNSVIFEKIMQLTQAQQDDEETFHYSSTVPGALQALVDQKVQLAFLLNPTRIEQVEGVASAGLIMPRKSTYFYPKVMVGMVMHPLEPTEEVAF
jgi:uncharacterized protein (DUF1015 family)